MPPFRRSRSSSPAAAGSPVEAVLAYHARSKHDFQRMAPSLGYLDWANQPQPFRRFEGAPRRQLQVLDEPSSSDAPAFDAFLEPGAVAPLSLDDASLSRFLFHALALSAGKRAGPSRWSLRVNPSSGNLHPTEGWLVLPSLPAGTPPDPPASPALWHYAPDAHALEQRADLRPEFASALFRSLPDSAFLVALSSVAWREVWKYGERAYRYVNHDIGHALGALRYAAALCGWTLACVPGVSTARLGELLGLDPDDEGPEAETPDLLAVVRPAGTRGPAADWTLPGGRTVAELQGTPNALSDEHHEWPIVASMERLCRAGGAPRVVEEDRPAPAPLVTRPPRAVPATQVIRARRSAVAMDGVTRLPAADFYRLLAATHPALAPAPFDALAAPPRVHLFLFVHRVDDVVPGLYLLPRSEDGGARLCAAMQAPFQFVTPPGCPPELPLLLLVEDDARAAATRVSCGQDIAGNGAFSLGMIAELEPVLRAEGPSAYPRLYWETGLVGQVLYLQAYAAGVSATGIGCFFDDAVHTLAGLGDTRFQSLYHFTVGGALHDARIVDELPYAHLGRDGMDEWTP